MKCEVRVLLIVVALLCKRVLREYYVKHLYWVYSLKLHLNFVLCQEALGAFMALHSGLSNSESCLNSVHLHAYTGMYICL